MNFSKPSSLAKGLYILSQFTAENSEWGVRELAEHLGYPRSTVQTLMKTLAESGFLLQLESRRYRLWWRAFELAGHFLAQLDVRKVAIPYLQKLADTLGEVVHLGVLDGMDVIYLEKVEGKSAIPLITRLGLRYPAHATAIGKSLLAFQKKDASIPAALPPLTEHTHQRAESLIAELTEIRKTMLSYDREESFIGLSCVAAPIFDYTGKNVAGISVSVPTVRFTRDKERMARLVLETAKDISKELGYHPKMSVTFRKSV